MKFECSDLKKINKKIVGEMNQAPPVVCDGKLLEEIGLMPTREAQAFSLAQQKPFESGNARTAFFVLYYGGGALSNRNISHFLGEHKAGMTWLSKND